MNIIINQNSMTWHGNIGEILAWLAQAPGDMRLSEYIRLNLH